jgi:hypothetical protein
MTKTIKDPSMITGAEAALFLGITFGRFKVAIGRGLGAKSLAKYKPHGSEAKPVQGGWSGKNTLYRRDDIERMGREYPWQGVRPLDTEEKVKADKARTLRLTLEPWVYACMVIMVEEVNSKNLEQGIDPNMDVRGVVQTVLRKILMRSGLVNRADIRALMEKSLFGRKALAARLK